MTDQDFMKIVINKGKLRLKDGKLPLVSIIVKDGRIVAEGHSSSVPFEPSGYNDLNCINNASKKLQTYNLIDCILYTTIEPCSMCLGCAAWAGLTKIIFGAFQEDVPNNPYEMINYHATEHVTKLQPSNGKKIEIIGGIMREECKLLMKDIKNWMFSK